MVERPIDNLGRLLRPRGSGKEDEYRIAVCEIYIKFQNEYCKISVVTVNGEAASSDGAFHMPSTVLSWDAPMMPAI